MKFLQQQFLLYDQLLYSLPQSVLTVEQPIPSSPLLEACWTLPVSTLCEDPSVFLPIPPLDILSSCQQTKIKNVRCMIKSFV